MTLAYESKQGNYLDKKTRMQYIAGTRDSHDVFDWVKIPLDTFENSNIYKNAEKFYNENKENIDTVVGHSAGGIAAIKLAKNHSDSDITPITYNAPVCTC